MNNIPIPIPIPLFFKYLKLLITISLSLFFNPSLYSNAESIFEDSISAYAKTLKHASSLIDNKPDSSLILLKKVLPKFQKANNFKNIIKSHLLFSDIYKNKGHYSKAYDHLWDALLIAEEIKATNFIIEINQELGVLYGIYEKYNTSLIHFNKALQLARKEPNEDKWKQSILVKNFYATAIMNRKNKKYALALKYLDSCSITKKKYNIKPVEKPYILAEKGTIYLELNSPEKARPYLEKAHDFFLKKKLSFSIITSLYLGDLYAKQEQWKRANDFYTKSLVLLKIYKAHGDKKGEIFKKLSISFFELNKAKKAYYFLKKSTQVSDSLFNIKTTINNELFQINNKYRETINQKKRFIKSQQHIIDRKSIIQSRLKLFIVFIIFILLAFFTFVQMRSRMLKIEQEKKQIKLQTKFERKKAHELTEFKSRELISNTLQMIEKDQIIEDLLQKLKSETPSLYKTAKTNASKKNMWKQFNKRFTEVNTNFYTHLIEKHPNLSTTEQKHCALIKLNFSSKEMATLLNISLNSVHISRHRIRKKMNLERNANLLNYITNITSNS